MTNTLLFKIQPLTLKALKWINTIIVREWRLASLVMAFMVMEAFVNPLNPLVLREILDRGISGTSRYSLLQLLIVFASIPLLAGLFSMGTKYFLELLTERTGNYLRIELYERVQSKSLTFFVRNKSGQLQQRILQEPGQMNATLGSLVTQFISSILLTISTLLTMFYLSPTLTWISLICVPLTLIPGPISARWTIPINVKSMDSRAEASSKIQETLSVNGMLLIKTSGTNQQEKNKFKNILLELTTYNLLTVLWMEGAAIITNFLFVIGPVIIMWVASREIGKSITIGTVVAFITYLSQLSNPLKSISKVWAKLPWLLTMINRLLEYRDDPDELNYSKNSLQVSNVKGEIEFKNVSFHHELNKPILVDVSLTIKPGEIVALVGGSGGGKTTIAYLINRLCDPCKGEITLDGNDLRLYGPDQLSKVITFVSQEPYLFHTTVRDNIAYGCSSASDEEIEEAARKAKIHEVISKMPQKYNTVIGERGFKLSTGEKQRLTLARAFLRNTRVVILDEVTSALDAISEEAVKNALFSLLEGRTSLIIAHRLSTIIKANRILVLDQGKIVEEGDFTTLMSKREYFYKLYQEQIGIQNEMTENKLA